MAEEFRWYELEELVFGLAHWHFLITLVIDHGGIFDVTHEYTRKDGSSARRNHFLYTMSCLTIVISCQFRTYRPLLNAVFGKNASVRVLFVSTLVISVAISALSLGLFRCFYIYVLNLYSFSDSWLWCYFVNRILFLFTLLLSRAIPPVLIHVWFAWSVSWQIANSLIRHSLTHLKAIAGLAAKEIQNEFPSVANFIVTKSNWLILVFTLIFTLYMARNTPLMQTWIAAIRNWITQGLSRIRNWILIVILYTMKKFYDKFVEKLSSVVYQKCEHKILAHFPPHFRLQENAPKRIYLVDKETQVDLGLKTAERRPIRSRRSPNRGSCKSGGSVSQSRSASFRKQTRATPKMISCRSSRRSIVGRSAKLRHTYVMTTNLPSTEQGL